MHSAVFGDVVLERGCKLDGVQIGVDHRVVEACAHGSRGRGLARLERELSNEFERSWNGGCSLKRTLVSNTREVNRLTHMQISQPPLRSTSASMSCTLDAAGAGDVPLEVSRSMSKPRSTLTPPETLNRTADETAEAEAHVRGLLKYLGDDPAREGLLETPARVVRALAEHFGGYALDPAEYLAKTFEEVAGYDELVLVSDIEVFSHCEHHMVPFVGKA